ncbi:hypothetical protein IV102_37805 [bacterium]|nr:hypothetical protein [bacterium]
MPVVDMSHYARYESRPFNKEEREKVTVLFGGLTWKHEKLLQGVLHNLNYNARTLPNITRQDLDMGKELIDVGACSPTIFTTGSLASFLKSEAEVHGKEAVADKYVFATFGACGPCRFGQYHESYSMALDGLGLRSLRMLLLAQEFKQSKGKGDGLEVNVPFALGVVWALLIADTLTDLEYLTRPYEVNPGETDRVLQECLEIMYQAFKNRPLRGGKLGVAALHFFGNYFTDTLRLIRQKFAAIEVDRLRVKARVKLTGEFWLQIHEGEGNYNIKRWLEQEGGEVITAPIAVWIEYLMQPFQREAKDPTFAKTRWKQWTLQAVLWIYRGVYNRFRKALGNLPYPLPDQVEMKNLAHPFYHHRQRGGEGHMLVGKALQAYHHKSAHMVCELTPYSCMPNTMSVGAMANVLGKHPDLLYAAIEVKGDADTHALSRCQMILTEARRRAHAEFEEVLARTGLTIEAIRRYERSHPEVTKANYRIPHAGCAGMAANYVLHLAGKI